MAHWTGVNWVGLCSGMISGSVKALAIGTLEYDVNGIPSFQTVYVGGDFGVIKYRHSIVNPLLPDLEMSQTCSKLGNIQSESTVNALVLLEEGVILAAGNFQSSLCVQQYNESAETPKLVNFGAYSEQLINNQDWVQVGNV